MNVGGLAIRNVFNEEIPAPLFADSVIATEKTMLPIRWGALGIVVATVVFSERGVGSPGFWLIVGATLFNTVAHIIVRKKLHRGKVLMRLPVGDALFVGAGILLSGGSPGLYSPLFSLALASVAMRLPARQAIRLSFALFGLISVALYLLPNRELSYEYFFLALFNLLIMLMIALLVRAVNRHRVSLDNVGRLVSQLPCGVILKDNRGIYANPYIYKALGRPTEPKGPYVIKLSQKRDNLIDKVWDQISQIASSEQGDSNGTFHETVVTLDEGTHRILAFQKITLRLISGQTAKIALVIDVTQERDLERQLQERERLRVIGTMTSMALHEVRNPLSVIRATAQLIGSETENDAAQCHANRIITVVEQLNTFLERLMNMGRIPVTKTETCHAETVLKEVIVMMTPLANRAGVLLEHGIWESVGTLYGDPDALRQVLVNLVQNAIDAMPDGGKVRLKVEADDDWVTFVVEDEGKGIPSEVGAHLFDPFFTTKETGTGLGLVISNQIVVEHGGKLWFESDDHGTTFFVRLPNVSTKQRYNAS